MFLLLLKLVLLALLIIIIGLTIEYTRNSFYWWMKNVKHQGLTLPIFGDNWKFIFGYESFTDYVLRVYNEFPNERFSGIFQLRIPTLLIREPELVRDICVKNFEHFTDRREIPEGGSNALWSNSLLALKGHEWRQIRNTLSPAFTCARMKEMYHYMERCAYKYSKHYTNLAASDPEQSITLEMKDASSRYANDVIATCAFGLECNTIEEPDNDFFMNGKAITNVSGRSTILAVFILTFSKTLSKLFNLKLMSDDASAYFRSLVDNNVKTRKERGIRRNDMLNLLIQARENRLRYEESLAQDKTDEAGPSRPRAVHAEFSDIQIASQATVFLFAGFDTVSNLMTFAAYELAMNPRIQSSLYDEIKRSQQINPFPTYEKLIGLLYMDMVISETLRKWPPNILIERCCTKDYVIPAKGKSPELELKTGDLIWVSVLGIHRDPQYYESPEEFDPERFSPMNRRGGTKDYYIPFGVGPRSCIASRFALIEAKVYLYHLLANFEIVKSEDTPPDIAFDPLCLTPAIKGGCWIKLKRRPVA